MMKFDFWGIRAKFVSIYTVKNEQNFEVAASDKKQSEFEYRYLNLYLNSGCNVSSENSKKKKLFHFHRNIRFECVLLLHLR